MSSLNWLFSAVAWIIIQIHAGLSHIFPANGGWAWGLSIFLLTVVMRIILFPLFVKQIQSSRKMQHLSPQIQALRKKHKNDRQRMNQEMMKLYQDAGANPLSGCLPLIVQMPMFFGLFKVLQTISSTKATTLATMRATNGKKYGMSADLIQSAQHAHIFGAALPDRFLDAIHHSSAAAIVVTGLAVLISSTTTFLTMKSSVGRSMQSGVAADNPMMQSQKYLVYLSPLFGLFGLTMPLGVLIYWVTTNSWTLAQSHYVFKKYPMPTAEEIKAKAAENAKSGKTRTGTAKTGTAKTGTARTGASKTGGSKTATGRTGTRTSTGKTPGTRSRAAASSGRPRTAENGSGSSRRTRKQEEEPQDIQDDVPETPATRQQPIRQPRSKRKR